MEEMPVGSPNSQTKASEKWAKKVGYISKSYRLKKEVVEAFAQACADAGVSQAGKLTEMMNQFVNEVNGKM